MITFSSAVIDKNRCFIITPAFGVNLDTLMVIMKPVS